MRVFVLAAAVLILTRPGIIEKIQNPEKVTSLSEGWYYMDGGKRTEVTLPALIRQEEGDALVLYNDGLEELAEQSTLTTRGAVYRLKISTEEQILYEYEDTLFPRNSQMASKVNCTAQLPSEFAGETIAFTYYNTNDGVYRIPEIYAGSETAVLLYHYEKDAVTLIVVFVMAILGIVAVFIALYIKHMGVYEKRFLDIACFLLFCVCWFLTDSSLAQTFAGNSPVIRYVSFYAFMLLAIPMLHFVRDTEEMKKYPVIDLVIFLFYANVIVQSILNYFGVFDFIDMLVVTHLLLVGGIAVLVKILVREYRESKSRGLYTILQAFAVVAGGGTLALILYWLLKIPYYEVFFEVGIVIMIILLIRGLIDEMIKNVRFKTESVILQRLANEDMLTGMKNRRSYEAFLNEIQENAASGQNYFLIFMDINNLKEINDTLGHNVGDEAIIATARILEKVYGNEGHCFRIGGDEFCAVLPDNGFTEEELSDKLTAEIRQYNKTCVRYQLSVARGFSSLQDGSGNRKTISDWKKDADLKMYSDKGWVKKQGAMINE